MAEAAPSAIAQRSGHGGSAPAAATAAAADEGVPSAAAETQAGPGSEPEQQTSQQPEPEQQAKQPEGEQPLTRRQKMMAKAKAKAGGSSGRGQSQGGGDRRAARSQRQGGCCEGQGHASSGAPAEGSKRDGGWVEKDEVPPNRLACRWGAACWPLWLLVVLGSVRRAVNANSDFRSQISDLRIDRSHSLFLQ